MSGLIMAAQLIVGLSFLVLIHELGHYLAARAFGIRVDKFFIFFDIKFKLWSKKIGDTEFGIGWLPLGGYCKIAGMIDESMDTEQLKNEPEEWEFRSKPAWQRFIVMVSGVVMNIIAGVAIFTMLNLTHTKEYIPVENIESGIYASKYARFIGFQHGDKIVSINDEPTERMRDVLSTRLFFGGDVVVKRNNDLFTIQVPDTVYKYVADGNDFISFNNYSFVVDSVISGYNAEKAGIKKGDVFKTVNNIPITSFGAFKEIIGNNKSQSINATILRKGDIINIKADVDSLGRLGFTSLPPQYKTEKYTLAKALKYGSSDAFENIQANISGFKLIFSGKEKTKNLSGPIGIAKVYGAEWNWVRFWSITGMISMILAFINILPIPALDGGHALFTLIEAVTRRKLPQKFMEITQMIGLVLLMILMVFVIGNDIINLF